MGEWLGAVLGQIVSPGLWNELHTSANKATQKSLNWINAQFILLNCHLMQDLYNSTMEKELDRVDRKLLKLLQQDASLPNMQLAEKTNLSAPACSRRVARLKELGLIRKTVVLVNPRALGYNGLVIIGVVLDRSTTDSFAAFEKAAAGLTGCLEVQLVTGEFDYFVKLRIKSIDSFNEMHTAQLVALPGVRQVRTFVCLKEVFETTVIPV